MHIEFESSNLTSAEAGGLILLLTSLFPQPGQPQANPAPAPAPKLGPVAVTNEPTPPANPPATEPTGRHRRTKAQIAADEAAEKQAAAKQTASEPTPATELAPAAPTDQPVSAEEFRALLNAYIAKNSMEAAIEKLRSFNCNRITEALSLPAEQLQALVEALCV